MKWLTAILAMLLGSAAPDPTLKAIAETTVAEFPSVTINAITYKKCGYPNAWYYYDRESIELCVELADTPEDYQRFVISHEMAHALISQYNVPYTGSEEDAADELAALLMVAHGERESLVGTAHYYWSKTTVDDPMDQDDHSSYSRRAWTLMCLYAGSLFDPTAPECTAKFKRATGAWARLLALHADE